VYDVRLLGWRPIARAEQLATWEQKRTLRELLGDERNRVWLCTAHHEKVSNGRLYLEPPESALEFAEEYGFTAELDADRMRRR
jgi:hypothetical protein